MWKGRIQATAWKLLGYVQPIIGTELYFHTEKDVENLQHRKWRRDLYERWTIGAHVATFATPPQMVGKGGEV